jgi:hypothetical protein
MSREPIAKAGWEVGSVIRRCLLSQMYQHGGSAVKLQDVFIGQSNSADMSIRMLHVQVGVKYDNES